MTKGPPAVSVSLASANFSRMRRGRYVSRQRCSAAPHFLSSFFAATATATATTTTTSRLSSQTRLIVMADSSSNLSSPPANSDLAVLVDRIFREVFTQLGEIKTQLDTMNGRLDTLEATVRDHGQHSARIDRRLTSARPLQQPISVLDSSTAELVSLVRFSPLWSIQRLARTSPISPAPMARSSDFTLVSSVPFCKPSTCAVLETLSRSEVTSCARLALPRFGLRAVSVFPRLSHSGMEFGVIGS
ncbi:uncharacterized protein FMAN_14475 [Fusarium mangiferae]|uniref:Uncharacterized protein n=1 Tax=Fusarium mangiferae TaxID=192010 RepID=A0A1L7UK63_FUSMA|nr:uncharacterized protein FMAN_14475 [Fusarium mangiferae]CVL07596.1 uncharacterized protein FMAN_14475 [Fusarium mangiferae]